VYLPHKPLKGDIIKSKVLPGFQFRIADLYKKPSPEEMINDPIYQEFVLPGYTEAKQAKEEAEQRASKAEQQSQKEQRARQKAEQQAQKEQQAKEKEQRARQKAEQRAEKAEQQTLLEQQARQHAEQQAKQLAAKLRELGINPSDIQ
jgi:hypothetical protein